MQERGVEPLPLSGQDPKSCASANSATPASSASTRYPSNVRFPLPTPAPGWRWGQTSRKWSSRLRTVTALAIVLISVTSAWAAEVVWPERDWVPAAPKSQGMSEAGLDAAAAYAQKYGGGSGCVIRHGYLIKEWGDREYLADIKSCTKGSVGATLLGLAIDDGLVKLDDLAQAHYPDIGQEPRENLAAGWLGQITVRHLATMTAGFDDGRPPKLVYRPGTRGIYSNDTSNMLAELLTVRFGADLADVMKERVLEPIGIGPADWRWRENRYRAKSIRGRASREFA